MKHWYEQRTHKDAPKDIGRLAPHEAATAWAAGWNACIDAATNEIDDAFHKEQGKDMWDSHWWVLAPEGYRVETWEGPPSPDNVRKVCDAVDLEEAEAIVARLNKPFVGPS